MDKLAAKFPRRMKIRADFLLRHKILSLNSLQSEKYFDIILP